MIYLRQHPEFIEGSQYMDKYAQLLSRALALVKNQVNAFMSMEEFGGTKALFWRGEGEEQGA